VGVRQKLGRINERVLTEGPRSFNPFTTTVVTVPTRTVNLEVKLSLPSKEGLTVASEMSILYRIQPSAAARVIREIGLNYENEVILPVFRSAAADVTSRFLAKDMHSGERATIETDIRKQMAVVLETKGILVENVLMKSIQLPAGLSRSIEEKLQAEQDAQRMEFIKQREQADAERLVIQSAGERDAQIIAAEGEKRRVEIEAEGDANAILTRARAQAEANALLTKSLTPEVLRNRAIEAFQQLTQSTNSKLIITNNETPFLGLPEDLIKTP
jgi:regulator of protease activity HflC (stomatin/prohibitin superfamily)